MHRLQPGHFASLRPLSLHHLARRSSVVTLFLASVGTPLPVALGVPRPHLRLEAR